jgi:hypothetical protein
MWCQGLTSLVCAFSVCVCVGGGGIHAGFHWGVGVGQQGAGSSSSIGAIGKRTFHVSIVFFVTCASLHFGATPLNAQHQVDV